MESALAIPFGVGMGLTMDEAALLLDLRDVYWTRQGLLSVQVSLGVTATLAATILGLRMLRRGEEKGVEEGLIPTWRHGAEHGMLTASHRSARPQALRAAALGGERLRLLAHPDHLVAARADPDEADRDAEVVGDRRQVVARLGRQVLLAAALADVALEAGQLLVLGLDAVDDRLVVGELVEDRAVGMAVAGADPERIDARRARRAW